jgi:hypothetical protein
VERLKKAGASRELAAALVEVQRETIAEAMDSTLATKTDLRAVRDDLKAEIRSVRDELKADIAPMRTELAVLKWMAGAGLGIGLTILFKSFH